MSCLASSLLLLLEQASTAHGYRCCALVVAATSLSPLLPPGGVVLLPLLALGLAVLVARLILRAGGVAGTDVLARSLVRLAALATLLLPVADKYQHTSEVC